MPSEPSGGLAKPGDPVAELIRHGDPLAGMVQHRNLLERQEVTRVILDHLAGPGRFVEVQGVSGIGRSALLGVLMTARPGFLFACAPFKGLGDLVAGLDRLTHDLYGRSFLVRDGTNLGIAHILLALERFQPFPLYFDDVDAASAPVKEFLAALVPEPNNRHPVVITVTNSMDFHPVAWLREGKALELQLEPLSEDKAMAIAADPAATARCRRRPLHLWLATGSAGRHEDIIPEAVTALDPGTRRLLGHVAVSRLPLSRVALEDQTRPGVIDRLIQVGWLLDGDDLVDVHPEIRDSITAALDHSERQDLLGRLSVPAGIRGTLERTHALLQAGDLNTARSLLLQDIATLVELGFGAEVEAVWEDRRATAGDLLIQAHLALARGEGLLARQNGLEAYSGAASNLRPIILALVARTHFRDDPLRAAGFAREGLVSDPGSLVCHRTLIEVLATGDAGDGLLDAVAAFRESKGIGDPELVWAAVQETRYHLSGDRVKEAAEALETLAGLDLAGLRVADLRLVEGDLAEMTGGDASRSYAAAQEAAEQEGDLHALARALLAQARHAADERKDLLKASRAISLRLGDVQGLRRARAQ